MSLILHREQVDTVQLGYIHFQCLQHLIVVVMQPQVSTCSMDHFILHYRKSIKTARTSHLCFVQLSKDEQIM
jgi:hypothetical protein